MCTYFVNHDSKLKKYIISLPKLQDSKGSKQQAVAIIPILRDYKIKDKLGYIISNNSITNNILYYSLKV